VSANYTYPLCVCQLSVRFLPELKCFRVKRNEVSIE